jgi:ribosomal protein L37AE/L43A
MRMEKAIACAIDYRSECPYCGYNNTHFSGRGTMECWKCKKAYKLEPEVI